MPKPDNSEPGRLNYTSPTFGTPFERRTQLQPVRQPKVKTGRIKRYLKRGLLILLAVFILIGGFYGWSIYQATSKLSHDSNPFSLFYSLFPKPLATSKGRVNVLLAGYSVGDPHHGGAALTDSIMIVSIDPKTKTGDIISVPRDMWVAIPGHGHAKINAAYEYGQSEHFSEPGYFPGGMGLLEKVVSKDFGVSFNYYALINYQAFKDAVNAVGGINVNIQGVDVGGTPDPRGIYDAYTHLKLPNGNDHLDGQQALDLARARGDTVAGDVSYGIPNSDFTRTQYQQKMLVALKTQAAQVKSLINPVTVLQLVNAVGNNVQTNLNVGQMETLYSDSKGMSNKNIKTITINDYHGRSLITNYLTSDGQEALIPVAGYGDFSQIKQDVNSTLYGQ